MVDAVIVDATVVLSVMVDPVSVENVALFIVSEDTLRLEVVRDTLRRLRYAMLDILVKTQDKKYWIILFYVV